MLLLPEINYYYTTCYLKSSHAFGQAGSRGINLHYNQPP
jgi:hypothetical protein